MTCSRKQSGSVIMFSTVSGHVETVVLLGKITDGPKDYVKIGLDVEDYYKIKNVHNKQSIK